MHDSDLPTFLIISCAQDDRVLLSAGLDGGVYEWEVYNLDRRKEYEPHLRKGVQYSHAIIVPPRSKSGDLIPSGGAFPYTRSCADINCR